MLDPVLIGEVVAVQTAALLKAKQLARLKPTHELLKYTVWPDEDLVWVEFVGRFGQSSQARTNSMNYAALGQVYAAYFLALSEACEERDQAANAQPPAHNRVPLVILNLRDIPY
jgi:hypothetical protein